MMMMMVMMIEWAWCCIQVNHSEGGGGGGDEYSRRDRWSRTGLVTRATSRTSATFIARGIHSGAIRITLTLLTALVHRYRTSIPITPPTHVLLYTK
jgi:hypothetical protein